MKMGNVMTVRLPEEDVEALEQISMQENIDKSTAVRELVEKGRIYFAITRYSEGAVSLGKAAGLAGLAVGEFMDILAKLGIENKLESTDYLAGSKAAKKLF